jgi:hypothetical protein
LSLCKKTAVAATAVEEMNEHEAGEASLNQEVAAWLIRIVIACGKDAYCYCQRLEE